MASDSQCLSFSLELTPTLTLKLELGLGLGLGLAWGHFQDKKFFVLASFKDFSLEVFDDTHFSDLLSVSQRLSSSHELTLTLTLKLSLGLGLAWAHLQNINFFILTTFKDSTLEVFDNTHLLYLVSDSYCLSFSQELTPTLTLGLSVGLGLGLAWGHFKDLKIFI